MKEKIIIFIVGLLLGAIISTGSIYFYTVANKSDEETKTQDNREMPGGNPPEMPSGQTGEMGNPPQRTGESQQTNNG